MHLQRVIERFGYKPNEVSVYLAALHLGECTCSDIAARVRLPRTSVQLMVDRLHKDGLMNFYVKRRYKYWIAEHPEKLITESHEREAALRAVMPELSAMLGGGGGRPMVKTFVGSEQLRRVHEDILAAGHSLCAILAWDEWSAIMGREYVADFATRRIGLHIRAQILAPKTEATLRLKGCEARELCQVRLLPAGFLIADAIFIYADKVAIVCLNELRPTAVLIDDPGINATMAAIFHRFWTVE